MSEEEIIALIMHNLKVIVSTDDGNTTVTLKWGTEVIDSDFAYCAKTDGDQGGPQS